MLKTLLRPRITSNTARGLASLREKVGKIDPLDRFPVMNIRLQGHDFVPLEKYQAYVHKIAKKFQFPVVDSYAVAAQTSRATTFKPQSTIVDESIGLSQYERVVRVGPIPAPRLQLFLQMIRAHNPIGVT
ncbi:unnamed protein product, partial [Mesorhabditis spiculigera]